MKLTLENSVVGSQLFVRSMNKLQHITHIAASEDSHNKQLKQHNRICVATLPGDDSIQLMATKYSSDSCTQVSNLHSDSRPFLDMYIRTCGAMYQVAYVLKSTDEANRHLLERDDIALLDSTKMNGLEHQFHFLAALKKAVTCKPRG
ncbi:hypothetical protein [Photobacterium lutimaris]|uniref:Uncharacterized protein n=1 Tax=Photobacterium lutimaris TaxID=388278 RepID=A0A2T3ITP8_9GAMM|nr:hypothetical protein [Photobacterium lutimaris]PSU31734.1 hypothetical protein C9I99_21345 [Photobacterium lutimaris]TDR72625.1 hypothetical protein DFP78_113101 [Photobacterium lutimaris]